MGRFDVRVVALVIVANASSLFLASVDADGGRRSLVA